jgi:hypothetical protein
VNGVAVNPSKRADEVHARGISAEIIGSRIGFIIYSQISSFTIDPFLYNSSTPCQTVCGCHSPRSRRFLFKHVQTRMSTTNINTTYNLPSPSSYLPKFSKLPLKYPDPVIPQSQFFTFITYFVSKQAMGDKPSTSGFLCHTCIWRERAESHELMDIEALMRHGQRFHYLLQSQMGDYREFRVSSNSRPIPPLDETYADLNCSQSCISHPPFTESTRWIDLLHIR